MIKRELEPALKKLARLYPVVSLTGPRQSGKSTLLQLTFPDYKVIYTGKERVKLGGAVYTPWQEFLLSDLNR